MKLLSFSKKEWMIMLIIIPPVGVLINFFLFGWAYFSNLRFLALATVITTTILMFVYVACGMIAIMLTYRFPKYSQTFRRIGLSFLAYIVIMFTAISTIFFGYDYLRFYGYSVNWNNYALAIALGLFVNILATSMNEGAGFFEKWQQVMDEAENLKKENLQSQLEGLKGQVKPHFLFNSLNALSSLISEDPVKAEKFLDEMSKVYRYMLRSNEEGLTTVEAETQFIQSYFHMLKTRYGDSLDLKTNIDERFLSYLLPPHTLQMLVENAVKHNQMHRDSPLSILIMTTNSGKLIVNNNLQLKTSKIQSNRIGLANISNKYKLMNQDEIVVTDDGREFSVVIPLLHP